MATRPPTARLALGSAQFGLAYGVSNAKGRVTEAAVEDILAAAWGHGIEMLDTAPAYGVAEQVIAHACVNRGLRFQVVSKTLPGADIETVVSTARRSAEQAGSTLDTLLVHHPSDLAGRQGDRLWRALDDLVSQGLILRLGISASYEAQPRVLAARFAPSVMQLPVSILDQRLIRDGTLIALTSAGIEIHARSLFLQGLLFAPDERLPPNLKHVAPAMRTRRRVIADHGMSLVVAAMGFIMSTTEVAKAVVGVTARTELEEIVAATNLVHTELDWPSLALDDDLALNPSRWIAT